MKLMVGCGVMAVAAYARLTFDVAHPSIADDDIFSRSAFHFCCHLPTTPVDCNEHLERTKNKPGQREGESINIHRVGKPYSTFSIVRMQGGMDFDIIHNIDAPPMFSLATTSSQEGGQIQTPQSGQELHLCLCWHGRTVWSCLFLIQ
jgi:hypothetical protein